ncbi:MAG: hybrid sensor histidine kinase/response regulator [Nitrospirae bacterium]|nr:hybrid sensor histidine kinase/response regulator [Nitrospirota bacterium]MBF0593266.1 hybrid sensor histidine kinase/response regulator [Nitrospirota bacterium]
MDKYAIKDELNRSAKGMRVLYAEDCEGIREDVTGILRKFFDVVDAVEDGVKALEMYAQRCYDIVISDIRMPGGSGIELTRKIKAINPEQAVIIMTAYDDHKYMSELINLGIDKFVIKPVDLINLLTNLLQVTTKISSRKGRIEDMLVIARLSAMNEILYSIAHHWRQPLSAVGLYVQDLLELDNDGQLDTNRLKDSVDKIMKLIVSMSHTIDEFSKHFKSTVTEEAFSIVKAIDDAIFVVMDLLNCNGIKLVRDYEADITIRGNMRQFSNVLILELLCNAIDALLEERPQQPYIKVSVTTQDGRPVITVFNNGGLLNDNVKSRLYEPYFSTKSIASGSGLGLYLARMVLEREFKGTINVSNVDDGVEFRIGL